LRDNDTRGNFESAGFRRALAFYGDAFDKKWAPTITNIQLPNIWDEFGKGFVTYYISGPWNIGEFKRREPQLDGHWSTAALPGPDGQGTGAAGGSSLVIFHNSKNKQVAWELAEFLSGVPQQQKFYELTGDMPSRRSAWENSALATDPYARAFHEQLERAKPTPKIPEWERIVNEMQLAAARVVQGHQSADQVLRDLDAQTDSILEKRRWMLARKSQ
jgi:multiple sugar transport system substrate-binding protein